MQIEYVKGDLFQTQVQTIVHGCNAQGVMGSGIAKIIKDRYPEAFKRYRAQYERSGVLTLGDIIVVPCEYNGEKKVIVNAITQEIFGRDGRRFVSYDAVAESMAKINHMFEVYGISEVAMPQIGAGLGGGDWNVIAAIIEAELKTVKPYVYILE